MNYKKIKDLQIGDYLYLCKPNTVTLEFEKLRVNGLVEGIVTSIHTTHGVFGIDKGLTKVFTDDIDRPKYYSNKLLTVDLRCIETHIKNNIESAINRKLSGIKSLSDEIKVLAENQKRINLNLIEIYAE